MLSNSDRAYIYIYIYIYIYLFISWSTWAYSVSVAMLYFCSILFFRRHRRQKRNEMNSVAKLSDPTIVVPLPDSIVTEMTSIYEPSSSRYHHNHNRHFRDDESLPMINIPQSENTSSSALSHLTSTGNCAVCVGYDHVIHSRNQHHQGGDHQQQEPFYAPAMTSSTTTNRCCCHRMSVLRCSCTSLTTAETLTGSGCDTTDKVETFDTLRNGQRDNRTYSMTGGRGSGGKSNTSATAGSVSSRAKWDMNIVNHCISPKVTIGDCKIVNGNNDECQ